MALCLSPLSRKFGTRGSQRYMPVAEEHYPPDCDGQAPALRMSLAQMPRCVRAVVRALRCNRVRVPPTQGFKQVYHMLFRSPNREGIAPGACQRTSLPFPRKRAKIRTAPQARTTI